jgi:hypothetical protein
MAPAAALLTQPRQLSSMRGGLVMYQPRRSRYELGAVLMKQCYCVMIQFCQPLEHHSTWVAKLDEAVLPCTNISESD